MNRKGAFIVSLLAVLAVGAASIIIAYSLKDRAKVTGGEEAEEEASWSGMDESVVEAYAAEHGREASGPLLPLEEGDILLFLFCAGGFLAGLVVGYNWRKIFTEASADGKANTAKTNTA